MARKILIHTIAFSPDGVSTAYLYNDIALKFKEEGYKVVVLTTTPQYNLLQSELKKQPLKRKSLFYYESIFHGITVKHIPQKKFRSSILRIIGFVYWHIVAFFIGISEKNTDVILSPSPPLTIGYVNILIGKIKKAKVIYNVQEIYPDLLIKEKGLNPSSFIIRILKRLERFVYNKSDAVTTIDEVFANTIVDRFKDKSKLKIIPNFVDTEIYKPTPVNNLEINKIDFPKTDALKLMYAGNIGYAQDWEPLIQLAIRLQNENIEFFVIGEGAMKEWVEKEIVKHKLNKVHLLPYQPRNLMPSLIAYSDIQFIFMTPKTEGDGFPSKVYTIMACERPLLVCSGLNTPIINFLENKDCAYLVTEKDTDKKLNDLVNILLSTDKNTLREMGKNGLDIIHTKYSKTIVTQQYVDLVNSLL